MKKLKMIWMILTNKYVSVYTRENDQEHCETHYETNAPNGLIPVTLPITLLPASTDMFY